MLSWKNQPGQDILLFGSNTLVQTLMQNDLVDHFNFLLDPAALGKGKCLYRDAMIATLILAETMIFNSGIVDLTYQNDKKSGVSQIDHSPVTNK